MVIYLKVLQINAVNGIKSTGRMIAELSKYLSDNEHESHVVYSEGNKPKNGYKMGNKYSKKLHSLFNRVFGKQEYYSTYSTKKLLKYIEDINPDIVHLNNLHASFINIEVLFEYLIKNDKSVVITLHDCWFYTGKCTHYTVDNCSGWQNSCGNCPRLKKDIPSFFFDKTPMMLKDKEKWFKEINNLAVIGVSDWITNEAKKSILAEARTIKRIYNWVDHDVFKPVSNTSIKEKYNLINKFIILGVASKWIESKGLSKFFDLSKKLDRNEVILLVGNIDERIILPKNVINIKETHDPNELAEIYSEADVFLNLSVEESFGKTTAEALSCGTPAIVYNSTANPELIGKDCGYVIGNENIKEVRETINKVKKHGKIFYQNHCLKFSKENFGKEKNMGQYLELYKQLIG